MKLIEIITGAIGKVWNFATAIIGMCLIFAFLLFGITIFMPDSVLRAIEIVKSIATRLIP